MEVFFKMAEEHERIDQFFELLEWLKQTDSIPEEDIETWLHRSPELEYKQKQLAYDDKQKTVEFFETIIDQPAFSSNDHKRLRKFLIDWYASHRTYVTQMFKSTDPFSMSSEALNEIILSFGFPYPQKIISTSRKAQFILDLINMYQKKGTPSVLVKALQTYFGLSNVILSEWWINRRPNGEFYAASEPIFPVGLQGNPLYRTEISYSAFADVDPLWHLSEAELISTYANAKIKLPSITSHISLQATVSIFGVNAALAILNRKLQESYEYWSGTGDLNRDISLSKYAWTISPLELTLLIDYVFNSDTETIDERFIFYNGRHSPLDIPESDGSRDDVDDVEFSLIIDEYNQIVRKPGTRAERDELLALKKESFSGVVSEQSVTDTLRDSGTVLNSINPELKSEFDILLAAVGSNRRDILDSLLRDLEYYLMDTLGVMEYPISYLITGSPIQDTLKDVMDFFKPYRARIREFISSMAFDDPLEDSQRIDDNYSDILNHLIVDKGYLADLMFENSMVGDRLYLALNMPFHEYLFTMGGIKDYLFTTITHMASSVSEVEDSKLITLDQWFEQGYGNELGINDKLNHTLITQKLGNNCILSELESNQLKAIIYHTERSQLESTRDSKIISIGNSFLETGPFGFDYGFNKDKLLIEQNQSIRDMLHIPFDSTSENYGEQFGDILGLFTIKIPNVADNIIVSENRIYSIYQGFSDENITHNDTVEHDEVIPVVNNIVHDDAFRNGLDEGGLDYFIEHMAQRLSDTYNPTEQPIIGTHIRLIEPSNNDFLDMSHVEDSIEIEIIDL